MEKQELSSIETKILNKFIGNEQLSTFDIVAVIGFSKQHVSEVLHVLESKGLVHSSIKYRKLYWNKTKQQGV